MRPYVKRALAQTIAAIEDEATAAYLEALRQADGVLASLVDTEAAGTGDAASRAELLSRADAVRRLMEPLLAGRAVDG
jgi:hypothetical protein